MYLCKIVNYLLSVKDLCRRTALRYTVAISGLCLMAPFCDVTNNYFLLEMLPLNLYFTYLGM